jgi:hypothetical protein
MQVAASCARADFEKMAQAPAPEARDELSFGKIQLGGGTVEGARRFFFAARFFSRALVGRLHSCSGVAQESGVFKINRAGLGWQAKDK